MELMFRLFPPNWAKNGGLPACKCSDFISIFCVLQARLDLISISVCASTYERVPAERGCVSQC